MTLGELREKTKHLPDHATVRIVDIDWGSGSDHVYVPGIEIRTDTHAPELNFLTGAYEYHQEKMKKKGVTE